MDSEFKQPILSLAALFAFVSASCLVFASRENGLVACFCVPSVFLGLRISTLAVRRSHEPVRVRVGTLMVGCGLVACGVFLAFADFERIYFLMMAS